MLPIITLIIIIGYKSGEANCFKSLDQVLTSHMVSFTSSNLNRKAVMKHTAKDTPGRDTVHSAKGHIEIFNITSFTVPLFFDLAMFMNK